MTRSNDSGPAYRGWYIATAAVVLLDSVAWAHDVSAVAIDPTTPSTLYAVTLGGGVFSIEQVEVSPTRSATATATATSTRTTPPSQTVTRTPTTTPATGGGGCAIEPTGRGSAEWWVNPADEPICRRAGPYPESSPVRETGVC